MNGSRIDQSSASILEDMQGETIDVCWEQIGGVAEDKVLLKVEQISVQADQMVNPSLLQIRFPDGDEEVEMAVKPTTVFRKVFKCMSFATSALK